MEMVSNATAEETRCTCPNRPYVEGVVRGIPWDESDAITRGEKEPPARSIGGRVYCHCAAGEALYTKEVEQKRKHDEDEDRRWLEGRRRRVSMLKEAATTNCRIPNRFWDCTLEGSPLVKANPDLVNAMVADAAEGPSSWYLWGPTGVGKSGLAIGYAKGLMHLEDEDRAPTAPLFWPTSELFTELRATYNEEGKSEHKIIKACIEADLLILDDLGVEKPSEWVQDRLYQIVNARHGAELPTIFTSNLSLAALEKRIGERTAWRIVEMCGKNHIRQVQGKNLRDVAARSVA